MGNGCKEAWRARRTSTHSDSDSDLDRPETTAPATITMTAHPSAKSPSNNNMAKLGEYKLVRNVGEGTFGKVKRTFCALERFHIS